MMLEHIQIQLRCMPVAASGLFHVVIEVMGMALQMSSILFHLAMADNQQRSLQAALDMPGLGSSS